MASEKKLWGDGRIANNTFCGVKQGTLLPTSVVDDPQNEKLWVTSYDGLDLLHIAAAAIVEAERQLVMVLRDPDHALKNVRRLVDRYRTTLAREQEDFGADIRDRTGRGVSPLVFANSDQCKEHDNHALQHAKKAMDGEVPSDEETFRQNWDNALGKE